VVAINRSERSQSIVARTQTLWALDYGQKRVIADRFAAGESMADLAILDANPSTRL